MGAAYGSAGERCMAISVAVVAVDNAGDALMRHLVPRVQSLKVGPGIDPTSEMGPLITDEHRRKVSGYVDMGLAEGADLVVDGRELRLQGYENGFFLGGCLFDNVRPEMRIYQEEIFGPVLCVVRTPDFETALKLTNDHTFGNGAAVFTRDGDTAREFNSRVEAGMVGVNVSIPVPLAFHSFGGWKQSLFWRPPYPRAGRGALLHAAEDDDWRGGRPASARAPASPCPRWDDSNADKSDFVGQDLDEWASGSVSSVSA